MAAQREAAAAKLEQATVAVAAAVEAAEVKSCMARTEAEEAAEACAAAVEREEQVLAAAEEKLCPVTGLATTKHQAKRKHKCRARARRRTAASWGALGAGIVSQACAQAALVGDGP